APASSALHAARSCESVALTSRQSWIASDSEVPMVATHATNPATMLKRSGGRGKGSSAACEAGMPSPQAGSYFAFRCKPDRSVEIDEGRACGRREGPSPLPPLRQHGLNDV